MGQKEKKTPRLFLSRIRSIFINIWPAIRKRPHLHFYSRQSHIVLQQSIHLPLSSLTGQFNISLTSAFFFFLPFSLLFVFIVSFRSSLRPTHFPVQSFLIWIVLKHQTIITAISVSYYLCNYCCVRVCLQLTCWNRTVRLYYSKFHPVYDGWRVWKKKSEQKLEEEKQNHFNAM